MVRIHSSALLLGGNMRAVCISQKRLHRLYGVLFSAICATSLLLYSTYYYFEKSASNRAEVKILSNDYEQKLQELQKEIDEQKSYINRIERVSSVIRGYNPKLSKTVALRIAHREIKYSTQYKVPLHIGLAISAKESTFNPKAVSYNGTSYGLKQVHRAVWASNVSLQKLTQLDYNTNLGYKIIREYYDLTGSYTKALRRYYGATNALENDKYSNHVVAISHKFKEKLS